MSLVSLWVVGLTALWLSLLTVVLVLVIRQVAIHQTQLSTERVNLSFDGPAIGSEVPAELADALVHTGGAASVLLVVSATCVPCRELVSNLRGRIIGRPVTALVTGREELAGDLSALLPDAVHTILGPQAGVLAQRLNVHSTPFAVEVEDGVVTRKRFLKGAEDFVAFMASEQQPAIA